MNASLRTIRFSALAAALLVLSAAAQDRASRTLDMYLIDVEGGNATLFVSPSRQSLLIDTGNGGPAAVRDADRMMAAIKDAGLSQIDHLITTHDHGDHFGAMADLAGRIPIREFIDHGPSVEMNPGTDAFLQNVYPTLYAKGRHTVVQPGHRWSMGDAEVRIVAAGGRPANAAVPGAGRPNPYCASTPQQAPDPGENAQSVGSHITFGRFRALHLGDLTWNKEIEFDVPGKPARRHRSVRGLAPRPGDLELPGLRARDSTAGCRHQQRHAEGWAARRHESAVLRSAARSDLAAALSPVSGQEFTVAGTFIANGVDDQPATLPIAPMPAPARGSGAAPPPVHNGPAYWIKVSARQDGSFTVTNTRNGFAKTYPAR